MIYELNGKNIRIPNDVLEKNMRILQISQAEAIQMYLEDEGYLENAEVEELTAKAKENKIGHDAKSMKPRKQTVRQRKPDEEKEKIIEILANALKNAGIEPNITNKSKEILFSIGENNYRLDLIKKRPKKA